MALTLKMPEKQDLRPRITVFGVGGAGGNAVNNMIDKNLEGAEFVTANTDSQALQQSKAPRRIQLGVGVTQGLGAGAKPQVGGSAAEESIDEIIDHLAGSHMCFITAGMGGGTGTGAAPVIARAAREMGILTVGVVTKPFQFEGAHRMNTAENGVDDLQQYVDTLIIIPNQNLFRIANERTTFAEAFMMADDVLYQGVKGVTDLMVRPGLINLDFADVRAVMDEMGKAMMGTGEADGDSRAIDAAEKAIANPLLDEVSLKGARGVLINITGGYDLTLFELDEAANRIRSEVDPDANIIVGSTLDPEVEGVMRVSVVATGIDAAEARMIDPVERPVAQPVAQPAPQPVTQPAPQPRSSAGVSAEVREAAKRAVAEHLTAEATAPAAPAPVAEAPVAVQEDLALNLDADDLDLPQAAPRKAEDPAPAAEFIAPAPTTADQAAQEPEPVAAPEPALSTVAELPREPKTQPQPQSHPQSAGAQKFGFNSLIHRMTGAAAATRPEPGAAEPSSSYQPAEEDLKIEIPAFLRRQAN